MDASKKILLSLFVIGLGLLVIFINAFYAKTMPSNIRSRASTLVTPNAVSLTLVPNEATFQVGDNFDVQIYVNTFGVSTSGVGARLLFEPRFLEVIDVTPGKIFSTYPASTFDNNTGTVYLSGIAFDLVSNKPQSLFIGTGMLGTVRFRTKRAVPSTQVRFDFTSGGKTTDSNVMDAKTAMYVLEKVYPATFTITL